MHYFTKWYHTVKQWEANSNSGILIGYMNKSKQSASTANLKLKMVGVMTANDPHIDPSLEYVCYLCV